jgi:hypothetical protein
MFDEKYVIPPTSTYIIDPWNIPALYPPCIHCWLVKPYIYRWIFQFSFRKFPKKMVTSSQTTMVEPFQKLAFFTKHLQIYPDTFRLTSNLPWFSWIFTCRRAARRSPVARAHPHSAPASRALRRAAAGRRSAPGGHSWAPAAPGSAEINVVDFVVNTIGESVTHIS